MPEDERGAMLDRFRRHGYRGQAAIAQFGGIRAEVRSHGATVVDDLGTEYLDCGGYGVFLLGHGHPSVLAAVREQLGRMALSTRLLLTPELGLAAEALSGVAPRGLDCVYFGTSGAEAVETALKLARLQGRRTLFAMAGGYHGKTFGALSVTERASHREPFAPLLPDVAFLPFGDVAAAERALASAEPGTACLILEPVQAEGGVRIPYRGYLSAVAEACRAADALLVVDEIQTGLGRLGRWWGVDAEGVEPDILLAGKALSGGLIPVSAVIATAEVFEPISRDPTLHSGTFANSPLAAAAARATIAAIQAEDVVVRAHALGQRLLDEISSAVSACGPAVRAVRGRGLLIGVEFSDASIAADFVAELLKERVIVSSSMNAYEVVRITPPAILDESDVEVLIGAVTAAAERISNRCGAFYDVGAEHSAR